LENISNTNTTPNNNINGNLNKNSDLIDDNMKLKEELNVYKKENEELKNKISKLNNDLILANKTLIDFKNNY